MKRIESYGKTTTQYDSGDAVRVRYVDKAGEQWNWQATVVNRLPRIVNEMHPYYQVSGSTHPVPHSYVVDSGDVTAYEPCKVCGA